MWDTKQRIYEIKMMWRQLEEFEATHGDDFLSGMTVRFQKQSYRFTTTREIHAFLTGALEAVRWLRYEEEKNDDDED